MRKKRFIIGMLYQRRYLSSLVICTLKSVIIINKFNEHETECINLLIMKLISKELAVRYGKLITFIIIQGIETYYKIYKKNNKYKSFDNSTIKEEILKTLFIFQIKVCVGAVQ